MTVGALFAVASAAAFGLNNAAVRRGVLTGSVVQGLTITVPVGLPFFLAAALLSGETARLPELLQSARALALLSLAGILHFVIGRYCHYRATKAVGASFAGPVQQVGVAVSFALGVLVLGETPSLVQTLGALIIMVAPLVLLRGDAGGARLAFRPDYTEGYAFGLLTAAAFGTSPVLIRAGLAGVNLPMAGGLVAYASATIFFAALVILTRQVGHALGTDRRALPWFLVSGLTVGLSQLFRFVALSLAPVTVVGPLQSLALVFRVLFGALLNREHEIQDRRVLLGVLTSMVGALVVAAG